LGLNWVIARARKHVAPMSFVLVVLAAQSFSLFHSAEHGFQPHKHDGKPCEISQYCDRVVGLDAAPTPALPVREPVRHAPVLALTVSIVLAQTFRLLPRGPPVLSN